MCEFEISRETMPELIALKRAVIRLKRRYVVVLSRCLSDVCYCLGGCCLNFYKRPPRRIRNPNIEVIDLYERSISLGEVVIRAERGRILLGIKTDWFKANLKTIQGLYRAYSGGRRENMRVIDNYFRRMWWAWRFFWMDRNQRMAVIRTMKKYRLKQPFRRWYRRFLRYPAVQ